MSALCRDCFWQDLSQLVLCHPSSLFCHSNLLHFSKKQATRQITFSHLMLRFLENSSELPSSESRSQGEGPFQGRGFSCEGFMLRMLSPHTVYFLVFIPKTSLLLASGFPECNHCSHYCRNTSLSAGRMKPNYVWRQLFHTRALVDVLMNYFRAHPGIFIVSPSMSLILSGRLVLN